MNKVLIITVAGTSSRFRESLGCDVLKCLYSTSQDTSILERLLSLGEKNEFSRIIVVGGYLFNKLKDFLDNPKFNECRLSIVYNDKFDTWGSNYSLYLGLVEALKDQNVERIVFAEGDLLFDEDSFRMISDASSDVITANTNSIVAKKSVVFYIDMNTQLKYYYDTEHRYIEINEPFQSIYNSGQVWSFSGIEHLKKVVNNQNESELEGTNLNIIQKYFGHGTCNNIRIITFKQWFNCNTLEDYTEAIKIIFS